MNRDALRYQLDGHSIEYEEKSGGFVVFASGLPPALVEQIGACGGRVEIGTAPSPPVFIIREVTGE